MFPGWRRGRRRQARFSSSAPPIRSRANAGCPPGCLNVHRRRRAMQPFLIWDQIWDCRSIVIACAVDSFAAQGIAYERHAVRTWRTGSHRERSRVASRLGPPDGPQVFLLNARDACRYAAPPISPRTPTVQRMVELRWLHERKCAHLSVRTRCDSARFVTLLPSAYFASPRESEPGECNAN